MNSLQYAAELWAEVCVVSVKRDLIHRQKSPTIIGIPGDRFDPAAADRHKTQGVIRFDAGADMFRQRLGEC